MNQYEQNGEKQFLYFSLIGGGEPLNARTPLYEAVTSLRLVVQLKLSGLRSQLMITSSKQKKFTLYCLLKDIKGS